MNAFLLTALIVESLVGIGSVLSPAAAFAPLDLAFNDVAANFARMFGSAVLALMVPVWFARRSGQSAVEKAAAAGLAVYYFVSVLVLLPSQLAGMMNRLGWSIIVLHVAMGAWAAYVIFARDAQRG
jgi:hypothetical protein